MKLILIVLMTVLMIQPSISKAEGDQSISLFPGILGTSCGPGWSFNKQTTWIGVTTRSLVNLTSSSSLAVTSGTSGCAKHNLVKRLEMAGVVYAYYNYESLIEDMAKGNGEHLQVFAKTYGCKDKVYKQFRETARRNFSQIVIKASKKAEVLYQGLKQAMQGSDELLLNCEALI